MSILETTMALAVMSGVAFTTIEMANEVETQHAIYQKAQMHNIAKAKRIYTSKEANNGH